MSNVWLNGEERLTILSEKQFAARLKIQVRIALQRRPFALVRHNTIDEARTSIGVAFTDINGTPYTVDDPKLFKWVMENSIEIENAHLEDGRFRDFQ